jgi:type II secretory ATPase GspE/PulE/Tfp pilus assembly ATPase PilB-like protein
MIISDDQLKTLLLKDKILDEKRLQEMISFAKDSKVTLTEALIQNDVISDENLGVLEADFLKLPFIILSKISIPEGVFKLIPERIARKQKIVPFARDANGIKLAMADPRNKEIQQLIAKKTGEKLSIYLATQKDIDNILYIYRKDLQGTFDEILKKTSVSAAEIIDLIIKYAYEDKASDIHIEPEENESLIRYRIDGILQDIALLPKSIHDQLTTRIKIMSRLRTDEHMTPQDGKLRVKLTEEELDIRVSIIPIADGEKTVLRLLSSHSGQFSLLDLGMYEADLKKVTNGFKKSYGMVLSTGPTGSGKTTAIYAILKILNTRDINVTTIEDPVEYRIQGVNQIQTNVKTNLTFASGLRSILRQDPNVIFVGEIRDKETAGIAVNAALTGHMVLSTVHTSDAATTLPRLSDMDIEPFLVASTVNVIIAQRLIRKICEMCKTSVNITMSELTKNIPIETIKTHFGSDKDIRIYKGAGCKVCHRTGYSGRIGLFEVLEVSKEIKKLILARSDSDVITSQAREEGMTTMLDDGLEKVRKSVTTLEEVLRVTKVETV